MLLSIQRGRGIRLEREALDFLLFVVLPDPEILRGQVMDVASRLIRYDSIHKHQALLRANNRVGIASRLLPSPILGRPSGRQAKNSGPKHRFLKLHCRTPSRSVLTEFPPPHFPRTLAALLHRAPPAVRN